MAKVTAEHYKAAAAQMTSGHLGAQFNAPADATGLALEEYKRDQHQLVVGGNMSVNEKAAGKNSKEQKEKRERELRYQNMLRQQMFDTQMRQLDGIIRKASAALDNVNTVLDKMQEEIAFRKQKSADVKNEISQLSADNETFKKENGYVFSEHEEFNTKGSIERDENGIPKDPVLAKYLQMVIADAKKNGTHIDPRTLSDGSVDKLIMDKGMELVRKKIEENDNRIKELILELEDNEKWLGEADNVAADLVTLKSKLEETLIQAKGLQDEMKKHPERFTRQDLEEQKIKVEKLETDLDKFWEGKGLEVLEKAKRLIEGNHKFDKSLDAQYAKEMNNVGATNNVSKLQSEEDEFLLIDEGLSGKFKNAASGVVKEPQASAPDVGTKIVPAFSGP